MQVTERITAIAIPRFAQSVTLWLAATSMFCANMMQPDAVMFVRTLCSDTGFQAAHNRKGRTSPVKPSKTAWVEKTTVARNCGRL